MLAKIEVLFVKNFIFTLAKGQKRVLLWQMVRAYCRKIYLYCLCPI
jgi:hypothetical protein